MNEWPRMIYAKGGEEEVFGLKVATRIVENEIEEGDAAAEGFCRTPFEAHGVEPPKADPIDEPPLDDEKLGLLDEIDDVRAELAAVRDELTAERAAHDATKAKLAETEAMLAEATKPAPKAKDTLSIKAS